MNTEDDLGSPWRNHILEDLETAKYMEKKKLTPKELYELAKEMYYKVYDFDKDTKETDKKWIRVGLVPDPRKEITWNFFNGERLISETNFDKAEDFCSGISIVVKDKKYNVLRDDGTLVFDKWWNYVSATPERDGYVVEEFNDNYGLDRKEAFANANGEIVSEWFSQIMPMLHDSLYCVSKKTGKGVLERVQAVYDLSKNKIVTEWYDDLCIFIGKVKFARIRKGEMYNLIGVDCKPVFEIWSKKPFVVESNGMTQIFSADGKCYNGDIRTGKLELVA